MPVIGYGIFFASLADFLHVLFPLQIFNAGWELQTIGSLIDQSWALLIGMGFICSRYFTENQQNTCLIEFLFLKFIRWFFLILAILYLFLAPLVVLNSFRMTTEIRQQVAQQQQAKITQIDQIQNQSSKITNPDQLRALAQSLNINKDDIDRLSNDKLPASIQQKLFSVKAQIEEQAAITRRNQLQKLWQNSIRMIFSQILLAFTFIFIWSRFGRLGVLDMTQYDIEN
ncbi:MAG: HpsJ family protein [Snowella sp.]